MKKNNPYISAVVVAAGRGTRMKMGINKQFLEISGKPVLARTLQVFEESEVINEVVLVAAEDDIVYSKQHIIDKYAFKKVKAIVAGGKERQNSVLNGLKEVDQDCDIVLIHDGARPFLTEESLEDIIRETEEFGSACAAVPVKDTIKRADEKGFAAETLDRSTLWAIQTPQAFKYELIIAAHEQAIKDGFIGTDDAVLAERLGVGTKLVMGSYNNIKITTQEDIAIAEAIAEKFDSWYKRE